MLSVNLIYENCLLDWENLPKLIEQTNHPKNKFSNSGYQLIDILLDYAGLGNNFISRIGIMHGTFIGMSDGWWKKSEASFRFLNNIFLHNKGDYKRLSTLFNSKKKFILVPHPFHFLINNYKNTSFIEPEGSVFFLPHGLKSAKSNINIFSIIKVLNSLPQDYWPIDICLHENDVNTNLIDLLKENNFGVVSAGSRNDCHFLHRLYWLSKRRKRSLVAEFGTSVIFSSLLNMEIEFLDEIKVIRWWPSNSMGWQCVPEQHYHELIKLFYEKKYNSIVFKNEVKELTGGNLEMTPHELKNVFLNAKKEYTKFIHNGNHSFLPPLFYSFIDPFYSKLEGKIKNLFLNKGLYHPIKTDIIYDLVKSIE